MNLQEQSYNRGRPVHIHLHTALRLRRQRQCRTPEQMPPIRVRA